jgi:hypothetical protein
LPKIKKFTHLALSCSHEINLIVGSLALVYIIQTILFVPHKERILTPSETPIDWCCLAKLSAFTVRIIKNKSMRGVTTCIVLNVAVSGACSYHWTAKSVEWFLVHKYRIILEAISNLFVSLRI